MESKKSYRHSPIKKREASAPKADTSWDRVEPWYHSIVGEDGHYFHQQVILPNLLPLMQLGKGDSLLDVACGQGILARAIPTNIPYTGIDISPNLIKQAKKLDSNPLHNYQVTDATNPFKLEKNDFSHATILLAIQNIEQPVLAFKNIAKHLKNDGKLFIVLNHPCFRIARQSSWQIDMPNKIQFRRIDRYMSALKIPIQMNPGKGEKSTQTWTFHHPISDYSRWLKESGFSITGIHEWCSNKASTGKNARMEDRARNEIPMFMVFECRNN